MRIVSASCPCGKGIQCGKRYTNEVNQIVSCKGESQSESSSQYDDFEDVKTNHDEELLKKGSYPWHLKQRILGERGHLSNKNAGALLSEIVTGEMRHVFLGHLSEENNRPYLAYETVEEILERNRIKLGGALKMDMAARYSNGVKITI